MAILELTAVNAVALMQQGDLKVSDYVDALIQQIKAHSALNAFISHDENLLRMQADELDDQRSSGDECGSLFGLTIAVKDNIETSDYITTGGTGAFKSYRPKKNAPVLQCLLNQGALILGKTNLHELAFGITSNNGVFGPVHNPYNLDMIAGGSSGGSAVAVASRMAPFAIGTDTGGSARIPPALCGIVGFRPTMKRYGAEGTIPISYTRDTLGTMARTVEDIQMIDQVISTKTGDKPFANLKGIRLGVARDYFFDNLDRDVEKATDNALELLRDLGAEIVDANIENLSALNEAVSFPICLYEAIRDMEEYLKHTGLSFDQLIEGIGSPDVKGLYQENRANPSTSAEEHRNLKKIDRPKLQRAKQDKFQNHKMDAMIFPTTKLSARPIGQDETVEINGVEMPTFSAYIHNTDPSSNAGLPGISVPMGETSDGLPMGLEFDAPEGCDVRLLKITALFQKAIGPMPAPKSG
jgi:mandelamide amidase